MDYIKLLYDGAVATMVIDHPSALNALNMQMLSEIDEALGLLDFSKTKCLIIRGGGDKAFVSGADIPKMKDFSQKEAFEFSMFGNTLFGKLENLPIPTIAAVCGYAFGGGCELAMACDIRLVSDNAVFAQPEIKLGITPGFGGTQRLSRLVGVGRAKEIMYTGRWVSAGEALAIGLCTAVYPKPLLFTSAKEMARKLAELSSPALSALKKSVNSTCVINPEIEASEFSSCFGTEEQRTAMQVFCDKMAKKE